MPLPELASGEEGASISENGAENLPQEALIKEAPETAEKGDNQPLNASEGAGASAEEPQDDIGQAAEPLGAEGGAEKGVTEKDTRQEVHQASAVSDAPAASATDCPYTSTADGPDNSTTDDPAIVSQSDQEEEEQDSDDQEQPVQEEEESPVIPSAAASASANRQADTAKTEQISPAVIDPESEAHAIATPPYHKQQPRKEVRVEMDDSTRRSNIDESDNTNDADHHNEARIEMDDSTRRINDIDASARSLVEAKEEKKELYGDADSNNIHKWSQSAPALSMVASQSTEVDVDDLEKIKTVQELTRGNSEASLDLAKAMDKPGTEASTPQRPQIKATGISPKPISPRKPAIRSIKEENSFVNDNSDGGLSMKEESNHSHGGLSDEKLNQIRSSIVERELPPDDSESISISSVPCTQQESHRMVSRIASNNSQSQAANSSQTPASDDVDTKRSSLEKGGLKPERASSAKSLEVKSSTNSMASAASRTSKGLWKGLKNRIGFVSAVRGSSKSKSPSRVKSGGSVTSAGSKQSIKSKSPSRKISGFAKSSFTTSATGGDAASQRNRRTAAMASRGGADKPNKLPNASANDAPIRRAQTSPTRQRNGRTFQSGLVDTAALGIQSLTIPSRGRGRPGAPNRDNAKSRSESPIRRPSLSEMPSSRELEYLDEVGKALKDGLIYTTVTDRLKQKTYEKCFDGSAAVDFLCNYTRKPRPQALRVGRELVQHFGLFVNATGAKFHSHNGTARSAANQHNSFMLQDSSTNYYRMVAYLPSEVSRMNMMTKQRLFEENVTVKTRRQGLRKHKKCFVGAEAVAFLVRSRIVKNRVEAVDLGKKFASQFNLFEPVNRDTDFMDSRTKLYRFLDQRNRYFAIDNMLSTRLVQMGREEDTDLSGEDEESSIGGKSSVSGSTRDSTEERDPLIEDDGPISQEHQKLFDVADIMERGIKVSDNTKKAAGKKSVSYKDTFVAARAVTFMVTSGLAGNREEATVLGRKLERELNLFSEVSGKHDFGDSNHFFRFNDKKDRFAKPVKAEKPLKEVAMLFEQGVKVKDYTHRLRTYKKTFIGARAVDFLVNSRLSSNRANAVRLGYKLVAEYNLFEKVTGDKEFCDDQCFFRFTPLDKRTDGTPTKQKQRSGRAFLLNRMKTSRSSLAPKHISEEMIKIAEAVLNGVKVKEHKFRAKPYRQTFVGSEAVSFMVNSSLAKSRKDAVELGKKLAADVGLFLGIDGKKDFKDDYLLYRFSERFEEELHDESDASSKPLRGLISGVTGSVNVKSLPLEKIAEAFRNGVKVGDHEEQKKTYSDTFLGSEAVDFLVGCGVSESRVEAVDLGRSLAREFSLFEHIHQDCEFEDEEFLYKFCYDGEIRPLEAIEIETSRLMNIAKDFELCVKTKTNKFRLRKYNNTFLGTEAVDYLVDSCVAGSRKEAVQIGRAVTKEFNLFEHVTNDRKFEDSNIPYFFFKNDERYKGLNLEKKRARRNIFASSDDDDSDSNESDLMGNSSQSVAVADLQLTFNTEDTEWANKMATFERRMNSTKNYISTTKLFALKDDESSQSSEEVRMQVMQDRFHEWACKFHRLDPRYQIRYFFDFVAQDGAEDAETKVMDVDNLRALYNFLPSRAQVFTVWRPTSADAIRKMMLGEAVGKGLDIKGKSAKRGKLSGFVPFLQIGENKHKRKIRPPSKEGVVRIFYPGEARRGRDLAAEKLERIAMEMIETVEAARQVLDNNDSSKSARKDALESMLLDMGPDPSIDYVDDYSPNRYGLEIPERLFWEAFFNQQDITRKAGSEYDTGRPSQPAFQDMNFAAIRAEPKEDAPRAVVYQGADPDSPMNPFELLVAYEENGRVMPVVSDFDCFLVGTKRVSFESPLPPEQLDVLKWYVKNLEDVMKTSKVGDSWTVNWLEVLKKAAREGFYPEMPRFGFGDPKSYSIMKNAVSRLSHSGAVRHGAECFNYYFPQDLDDEFLVIANDLPDNKPWAYVDVEGLQDILAEKIEQGFTFPLNPKWVLSDAFRWKELYDKLLLSDKEETKQSMKVWFPPDSGLREIIERVHESRPNGFYKGDPKDGDDDDSDSDSTAVGGAGAKQTMMSTVVALRLLEKFQQRTKSFQSSGESNDEQSDSD